MKTIRVAVSFLILLSFAGCNLGTPTATPPMQTTATESPTLNPSNEITSPVPAGPANVIFINGILLTMDDTLPAAQAVVVQGNKIIAVGTNEDILKYREANSIVIDLGGKTLVPGFIDAHQHRIRNGPSALGFADPSTLIQAAVQQGLTTIDELYVEESN